MPSCSNGWYAGIARKHGFAATFMAKPYGNRAGSGFHAHFSLLDENGVNVFDNGGEEGSEVMLSAVAGLLATMQECTLAFAPHENSYRRLLPGAHAPTGVAWGYGKPYSRHSHSGRQPQGAPH